MKSIRLVLLACFALYSANLTAQALETSVQEVSGRPGDTVTVDVQVTHFSDITSLSGSLTWDSAVANYVGFAENTSLSTNGTISFFTGLPGQGNIPNNKITWIYTNTSTSGGVTLPDGDFVIQVQLEIIGQPLDTAELALDNSPPTAQFTRFDSANPTIPITQSTLTTNGQLTVREPRIVQTANILNDTTWTTGSEIILDGYIFVANNATLTIEPGVVIRGLSNDSSQNILSDGTSLGEITDPEELAGALIITKGSQISAIGSPSDPIIFTAAKDDLNNPNDLDCDSTGLWSGLFILGNAIVNSPMANSNGNFVENTLTDLITSANSASGVVNYGGNVDTDNSGNLQYVSIRHGGAQLGGLEPVSGLTLAAVGQAGTFDFVEVLACAGDGIKILGGRAEVKHAVVSCPGDDAYTYDLGYRGQGQFWLGIDPGNLMGDHQGGVQPEDATPFSTPIIFNATYIGKDMANGEPELIKFTDNGGGNYKNSVFYQSQAGISLEFSYIISSPFILQSAIINDPFLGSIQGLDINNCTFSNIQGDRFLLDEDQTGFIASTVQLRSISNAVAVTLGLTNGSFGNNIEIANLIDQDTNGAYDLRPTSPSNNLTTAPTTGFFDTANYAGAINPSASTPGDWLGTWAASVAYGLVQ